MTTQQQSAEPKYLLTESELRTLILQGDAGFPDRGARDEQDDYMRKRLSKYRAAPPAVQPLTAQQLDALIESHCGGTEIDYGQYSAMVIFAASVERAHGIGTDHVAPLAVQAEPVGEWRMKNGEPMHVLWRAKYKPQLGDKLYAAPPADDEAVWLLTEVAETVPNMSIELELAINAYLAKAGRP